MRLYSMHKREFGLVFLAFFACFGLGVFVGLAGNTIERETRLAVEFCKVNLYVLRRTSDHFHNPTKYFPTQ